MTGTPLPLPPPSADLLPPPGVLRERLARTLRDAEILRALLRLSEREAKLAGRRPGREGVAHAAR